MKNIPASCVSLSFGEYVLQDWWVGKVFAEKEVSVYYRFIEGRIILLTVKARYGSKFHRKEVTHEV